MKLYHGSDHIVKEPLYGTGNRANDFGRGFYCTEDIQLAGEWACQRGSNGYINTYDFDANGLAVLNLLNKPYDALAWIALLLKHRMVDVGAGVPRSTYTYIVNNFSPDIEPYDIIIGYRADDSYFSYARAFINNTLPLNELYKAMHLGKLGTQIVLKTPKAFEHISFAEYKGAPAEIYYPQFIKRDETAKNGYKALLADWQLKESDLLALDIIRKNIQPGDTRLTKLLEETTKENE